MIEGFSVSILSSPSHSNPIRNCIKQRAWTPITISHVSRTLPEVTRRRLKSVWVTGFLITKAFRSDARQIWAFTSLLSAAPSLVHGQQHPSVSELLQQFETRRCFGNSSRCQGNRRHEGYQCSSRTETWLAKRPALRGNAAFIYAGLGDTRGFDVIVAILRELSERPEGQGIPGGMWSLPGQIAQTATMPRTCWVT